MNDFKGVGQFVVADSSKCTGCRACEMACFAVHNKNNKVNKTVGSINIPIVPRLYLTKFNDHYMPVQCKQCEENPCLLSCGTGAITRVDGTVIIDQYKCIGCKNCIMACPFGCIELFDVYENEKLVRQIDLEEARVFASKCDKCYGLKTQVCVKVCPNGALRLVDIEDENRAKKLASAQGLASFKF